MSPVQTTLPPRPDLEVTPSRPDTAQAPLTTAPTRKRNPVLRIALGAALLLVAAGIGATIIAYNDDTATTRTESAPVTPPGTVDPDVYEVQDEFENPPANPQAPSEPNEKTESIPAGPTTMEIRDAASESSLWTDTAVSDLEAAQQAANAGDVELAASNTYLAAEDYVAVAEIWRGVDSYVAKTADEIAHHLYGVADDISNYRFTRATSGLYDAMDDMNALTQYVDGLA